MEQAGELVGRLHNCMEEYGGELKVRDKYFLSTGISPSSEKRNMQGPMNLRPMETRPGIR